MRDHYCAKCGKKIVGIHVAIPGRTPNRPFRYHTKCKPQGESVEVRVEPGKQGIDLG